jgi:dihydroflavonol-4-reductase
MKKTVYLLSGAAGFLGSNVSRSLLSQGKKVRALVLEGDRAAQHIPAGVEIIWGNLLDPQSLERFFAVPEDTETIVLHCASFVTVNPEFNQKVYDVNVTGTKNIIDKCLEHGMKKLVYVSSTGAIPELPHGEIIREVDHFNPDLVRGCYSRTKAQATQLVLDAVRDRGLDASIVYPSGIAGPNDFAYTFFATFILDAAMGKMPAGIEGSFNAVDVRDLAEAVIACAEKGRKGEGYILSNSIVGIADIFHYIHKHSGAKAVKMILPVPVARVLAFFAEAISMVTKKPALFTGFSVYNLARNNNFSCEKAKRELGFHTRPFEESIADTVAWLCAEGKIQVAQETEIVCA